MLEKSEVLNRLNSYQSFDVVEVGGLDFQGHKFDRPVYLRGAFSKEL